MPTSDDTLFDLEPPDTGDSSVTHVLMPNMAYACGGSILTKLGGFLVGVGTRWADVTCPECLTLGLEPIQSEIAAQQGRQAGIE